MLVKGLLILIFSSLDLSNSENLYKNEDMLGRWVGIFGTDPVSQCMSASVPWNMEAGSWSPVAMYIGFHIQ